MCVRIRLSARHPVSKAHYRLLVMVQAARSLHGKIPETFISIFTHNGLMRTGMSYGRRTAFLFVLLRKTRIVRGSSDLIIAWEDTRNVHFDIYAQRIDAHGNVLWKKDGVSICSAPENQNRPRIVRSDHCMGRYPKRSFRYLRTTD